MENVEILAPKADSIISSLRSIGYSFETAIADLIDNAISAGATIVDINSPFDGENTILSIFDDGLGMDDSELHSAMRLGSSDPVIDRKSSDLGRFGLGLKTASFSQCRKFSVLSKKNGKISSRTWDLDLIKKTGDWTIIKDIDNKFLHFFDNVDHGTVVVWQKMDRVISNKDKNALNHFNHKKKIVKDHLSLTFHRFLEKKKLKIVMGGNEIKPWNPFLPDFNFLYMKREAPISLLKGKITMQGFVMPHKSYFDSETAYKEAALNRTWTTMQGFYVYRADRLLVAGDWLGLKKPSRYYDLARIKVDISNEYDFDWDIDVKKSKATPPDYLRQYLKDLADSTCKSAYETYSYRGDESVKMKIAGKSYIGVWNILSKRDGSIIFNINSDHPYINYCLNEFSDKSELFKSFLKFLAATIPYEQIQFMIQENENSHVVNELIEDGTDLFDTDIVKQIVAAYISKGYSEEQAKTQVKLIMNF